MSSAYWTRIRDEADRLGTDGCSWGGAMFRLGCLRHDVEYRSGVTIDGDPITKEESDLRLRSFIQSRSWFGWYSPVAWLYWSLLQTRFGQKAWDDNAKVRAEEARRRAALAHEEGIA